MAPGPRHQYFARVIAVVKPCAGTATVTWTSTPATRYQVWQTLNLKTIPWTKLRTPVTAVNPITLFKDPNATATKFYRVEQFAP